MPLKFFITGTDTDIGKTYVAVALLKKLNSLGYKTIGLKPIASGCSKQAGLLTNNDALLLQQAASIKLSYEIINPIALQDSVAPHIAAKRDNVNLIKNEIIQEISKSFKHPADIYVIEGVGGWNVPLNAQESMADVVTGLNLPVILVVGIKLGCLNHAILTHLAIEQRQIPIVGWMANCIDPNMAEIEENILTLKHWLKSPCLGVLPYAKAPIDYLDLEFLL